MKDQAGHFPILVFLSDGITTLGERKADTILKNIRDVNNGVVTIFGLAFGDKPVYELMREISVQNMGFARLIYFADDVPMQINSIYEEISTTLIRGLKIEYSPDAVQLDTLTRTDFNNVFNGSEIVVAGKLKDGVTRLSLIISGTSRGGKLTLELQSTVDGSNNIRTQGIPERIWAFLTIKQLMDRLMTETDPVSKVDIQKRIIYISIMVRSIFFLIVLVSNV